MKINVITLGCPKNVVDSEVLRAQINGEKIQFIDDAENADTIIINTCAFILPAREEAIDTILEAVELKKSGQVKNVFVTGCLPQMSIVELEKEIPEVDGFFPERDFTIVGKRIADFLHVKKKSPGLSRNLETPSHYAYLKISDGCDNRCRYCTIPLIKGRHRSQPAEKLLGEAEELVDHGVRELILVAQDTTYYGRDWGEKNGLVNLIRSLAKINDLKWIRLLYAHPAHVTDELIQLFQQEEKLCRYVDLPIQHISDPVLKSMGRPSSSTDIRAKIEQFRESVPEMAIRTTVMVGYPGESDEDFAVLRNFIKEIQFDRLGAFKFIPEDGTPAASLPNQIDESVKEDRMQELMEIQYEISYRKNSRLIGKEVFVIIDEKNQQQGSFVGRTEWDSPLIDNLVHVSGNVAPGDILPVKIERADSYDLWGKL
ncbi:ribosomal protein S12 methylthiotransferase RimO [candidate division KSB1 bacterium 4484_87]|nr:MAG: ribosomal protein S12 methylthiotransferase RimO [candidate division KSB1 bacterium 4484_87]